MKIMRKQHVASGSYYVSKSEATILQAFLGTCVAIALYDKEANVGGILHGLLAEPNHDGYPSMPEKYISTGLPICLEKLYELGATDKNLTAYVAGGALIQPIWKRDAALNIGGKSAQIAKKILSEKNIPIKKSETGGIFGYSLNLNMKDWSTEITHAIVDFKNIGEKAAALPTVEAIYQSIETLQPIPQIALTVMEMIDQKTSGFKDIANEVKKDQVLCGKILKLCNSSLYLNRFKIESIDEALMILGQDMIAKLVISVSVSNLFNHPLNGYSLSKGGLFHHAVGTAIISQKLAEIKGDVAPTVAYTAGLLHDIGKIVLDQYVCSASPLFYQKLTHEKTKILSAEIDILGVNHIDIGKTLAENWGFPETLKSTIMHHHDPGKDEINPKVTHIVALANLLMHMFNAGPELYRIDVSSLNTLLEANEFTMTDYPNILDEIPFQVLTSSPELAIFEK